MKVIPIESHQKEMFHRMNPSGLFTSEDWCNLFPESLIRFLIVDDHENPVGGFIAYEGGKNKLRTLITPPFTPHIGLFAIDKKNNPVKKNSFRKDIIESIATFLKNSSYVYYKLDFAPQWVDMQPMLWQHIETNVRYTYRIDLKQTVEDINSNLDVARRNKINKAGRDGFIATHQPDAELAYRMIAPSLKSKGISTHDQILRGILNLAAKDERCHYSFGEFEDKKHGVTISIGDHDVCYNLLSAVDRSVPNTHSGTMSLYHAILHAREKGFRIFDFEGSGVPEIEDYFRSFGGALVPYFSVCGGRKPWPWLLKISGKV
jgi:hypothetical protein